MARPIKPTSRATGVAVALVLTVSGLTLGGPAPVSAAPVATQVDPADTSLDPIPPQYPFVCTVAREGLGQPKVDNQDREGIPVAREDEAGNYPQDDRGYPTAEAEIVGWSRDCEIDPVVEYRYRSTDGSTKPLADPTAALPADIDSVTTTEGVTAPYVIRWERGTINRYIYSVAMLAPVTETDPEAPQDDLWNGRVVFSFDGGVAIGRSQGRLSQSGALYHEALSLGYAILYSSGTRTNTHYNLTVGGQTAVMVKDHFVATHGDPLYTVGVGGSGGAIQQYVYAQNHPGLIDGGVPQYSYSDMITQTIHVGDCELLEHYFDQTDGDNPRWRDVDERQLIEGLNAEPRPRNLSDGAINQWNLIYGALYPAIGATPPATPDGAPTPGLTECRKSWYGLTPLVLNPTFTNVDDIDKLAQGTEGVEWTHAADAVNVYGTDESGFARNPYDNVGVQYGLEAVAAGQITPEEFLDLNAQVGSWKEPEDMVPEGCPFDQSLCGDPTELDPWSARQMNLSPDGGVTPAPRRQGDIEAMHGAYDEGLVFRGAADIPFIDWRHYLEEELDMHHSSQSFATRQRMDDEQGNHDNQIIWFTDARPERQFDQTAMALEVLHDWIMNIKADPSSGIGANKPAGAVDSCFATDGTLLASGSDVWDGILDDGPAGACTEVMPPYSTSRREAGGPITGLHFKCQTRTVDQAVAEGAYGTWTPTAAQILRMERIHPDGVCDYDRVDAGDPRADVDPTPLETFVEQIHRDLVGREPSPDERATALERLRGGLPRGAFVAELIRHPEARERTITEAYQQVLGRGPDAAGLAFWDARLEAGFTRTALFANLLNSGEVYRKAGSTPEGYVVKVYEVLLDRAVEPGGEAHWVAALDSGTRRWFLARAVYGSAESRRLRAADAYQTFLGRSPDAGGLAHWSSRLTTVDDLDLAVTLAASREYFNRPVPS